MAGVWWLSLRFVVWYGVLLAALALPPLHHVAGALVAALSAALLHLCAGQAVHASIADGRMVLTAPDGGQSTLSVVEHVRNLALFAAIVLAAATARDRRMVRILLSGLIGLILLDAAIVAAEMWQNLEESLPLNAAYQVLVLFGVYHATGAAGMFAAPVFVGGLAVLVLQRPPDPARPPRNARCPCGSGRKYRQCCGR
jgi:hypothetical protein